MRTLTNKKFSAAVPALLGATVLISIYISNISYKIQVLYALQSILTGAAVFYTFRKKFYWLSIGLLFLLLADISYCYQVYLVPTEIRGLFFALTTSLLYAISFISFTGFLVTKIKSSFPLVLKQPLALLPAALIVVASSIFFVKPLLNGLIQEGLNTDRLSGILSLSSSVPLIIASYFAILFVHSLEDSFIPAGMFLFAVVDWAIQFEFLNFGELYFTYYDFLWFFAIILIFSRSILPEYHFSDVENKISLRVMLKIAILMAGIIPTFIYGTIIGADPKAQITILLTSVVLSLFISILATHQFNDKLEQLNEKLKFIFDEKSFKTIPDVTDEWVDSVKIAMANKIEQKNKAAQARYEMARQVAHDIRSPLSALLSIAKSVDPSKQRELIESVINRIAGIADDLLSAQKPAKAVPSGQLLDAIKSLIAEKSFEIRFKNISFKIDASSFENASLCYFDKNDLQSIFSNIFNNAVDAKAQQIDLKFRDLSQTTAAVDISDDGKGIQPEIIARLGIEPVTFGKATGHGIGLFSAKKTLLNWGGDLAVTSDGRSQTTVQIILKKEIPLRHPI